MICVQCGSKNIKVTNSRPQVWTNRIWRRRHCQQCFTVFTTEESIDYSGAWRVKYPDNDLQPFLRDKLLVSVLRSCGHRKNPLEDAQGLTDSIIYRLLKQTQDGIIEKDTIIQITKVALNRFDTAASVHYTAHHQS